MKNFFKKLSKSLSVIAIVLAIAITFVACSNNKSASNIMSANISNVTETSQLEASPVQDTETDTETDDEVADVEINGIYKFTKSSYNFSDIYYKDLDELTKFFETKDLNGVYDAVYKLGFADAANKFNKTEGTDVDDTTLYDCAFLFNENKVYIVYYESDNEYRYTSNDGVEFTAENGKINFAASSPILTLEYNEDGSLTLYLQFTYTDDNNNSVTTPLYIKGNLSKVANSENINSGKTYEYSAGSAVITSTFVKTDNMDAYLSELAKMFNIDENTDSMEGIVNVLSNWKFEIDFDLSRIVLKDTNKGYEFFSIVKANANDVFAIGNVNFTIDKLNLNLTTAAKTISMTVTLDENTVFVFDFIAA
jgi:hypothetical protein